MMEAKKLLESLQTKSIADSYDGVFAMLVSMLLMENCMIE